MNNDNIDFKKKLYLNVASTVSILITIILIIYENVKKKERFFSLMALSLTFILMATVQFTAYRQDGKSKRRIFGIIYLIIGVINLLVLIYGRFKG